LLIDNQLVDWRIMENQIDGRFDLRSGIDWRWKKNVLLDRRSSYTMLIGDQADWSLIGGGKTGPYSDR